MYSPEVLTEGKESVAIHKVLGACQKYEEGFKEMVRHGTHRIKLSNVNRRRVTHSRTQCNWNFKQRKHLCTKTTSMYLKQLM